jgi:hypothetical protein
MINVICAVCRPLLIWSASQRTRWSLDPMLRWITGITLFLFQFRIQIIIHSRVKLSCYMILIRAQQPVMPWGGSLTVGPPPTWPPPPSGGYWQPSPLAGHPGQSSSTPSPPSNQGYWPLPPWASPTGEQSPPWGMPPWMTPTSQPQRPSSSPPMVSRLCLLSIVPFVIRANIECLAYSSIYVFKRPSSSARCEFVNGVLNMGGSSEGEGKGGGTGNNVAPWSSCMSCCVLVWRLCRFLCEDYADFCVKTMYCCVKTTNFYWFMSCCVKTICIVV